MKSLQIHQPGYQPLYHIKPPTVDRRCRKSVSDTHALFRTHILSFKPDIYLINLDHERKCLFIFRGGMGIDNC